MSEIYIQHKAGPDGPFATEGPLREATDAEEQAVRDCIDNCDALAAHYITEPDNEGWCWVLTCHQIVKE